MGPLHITGFGAHLVAFNMFFSKTSWIPPMLGGWGDVSHENRAPGCSVWGVYIGDYATQLCGDYTKKNIIMMPIKQQVKWKVRGSFFTGSCD